MTNLLLSLLYAMFPHSGNVLKIGDGPPSMLARAALGFPWPLGTIVERDGHQWEVRENSVHQLD